MRAAVKNVEEYLSTRDDERWRLPAKAETPLQTSYRPELDVTPELEPLEAGRLLPIPGGRLALDGQIGTRSHLP